ncbi:MAG: hypothetical protein JNM93_00990 [Bacteriovoracaceae bacterium]|nr:hypothetical protein [Bacteriovoracaceae bacterium]
MKQLIFVTLFLISASSQAQLTTEQTRKLKLADNMLAASNYQGTLLAAQLVQTSDVFKYIPQALIERTEKDFHVTVLGHSVSSAATLGLVAGSLAAGESTFGALADSTYSHDPSTIFRYKLAENFFVGMHNSFTNLQQGSQQGLYSYRDVYIFAKNAAIEGLKLLKTSIQKLAPVLAKSIDSSSAKIQYLFNNSSEMSGDALAWYVEFFSYDPSNDSSSSTHKNNLYFYMARSSEATYEAMLGTFMLQEAAKKYAGNLAAASTEILSFPISFFFMVGVPGAVSGSSAYGAIELYEHYTGVKLDFEHAHGILFATAESAEVEEVLDKMTFNYSKFFALDAQQSVLLKDNIKNKLVAKHVDDLKLQKGMIKSINPENYRTLSVLEQVVAPEKLVTAAYLDEMARMMNNGKAIAPNEDIVNKTANAFHTNIVLANLVEHYAQFSTSVELKALAAKFVQETKVRTQPQARRLLK